MEQRSITDIIDNEYYDYSLYTIEDRAIPSAIDGLKPVQRKLLYKMLKDHSNKRVKIADLGGISPIGYHHGEVSAQQAASKMAQKWRNNMPLFEEHGFFGSRAVKEPGAPRYIFATLSENYKKYFTHNEVVTEVDDEDHPEPVQYLPLVPWSLVNPSDGIAVGHASKIIPRDFKKLKAAVVKYIETGNLPTKNLPAQYPQFKGTLTWVDESKLLIEGIVQPTGKLRQFEITEIPVSLERESYLKKLTKLEDQGKITKIEDWTVDADFKFIVTVDKDHIKEATNDLIKFFSLSETLTENLTLLDDQGKLKIFKNDREVIEWFCNFRLNKCQEYIDYKINSFKDDIFKLECRLKFIKMVVSDITILKQSTNKILSIIKEKIADADFASEFVRIPIYKFTDEEIEALNNKIMSAQEEHKYWQGMTAKQEYLKTLEMS